MAARLAFLHIDTDAGLPVLKLARAQDGCLYIQFFELPGVTLDPDERQLFAQFLGVAIVSGLRGTRPANGLHETGSPSRSSDGGAARK